MHAPDFLREEFIVVVPIGLANTTAVTFLGVGLVWCYRIYICFFGACAGQGRRCPSGDLWTARTRRLYDLDPHPRFRVLTAACRRKGGESSEVVLSAKCTVTPLAAAKAAVGKSDTAMTSASIRAKKLLHIVVYLPSGKSSFCPWGPHGQGAGPAQPPDFHYALTPYPRQVVFAVSGNQ